MSAILFLWTTYTFILLFLWTMICIMSILLFCGLWYTYVCSSMDYMYMSIMLFLWIIWLLRPHAYVYTALFVDNDIHMSAILWTTYTCLYCSFCGLHTHVYTALFVDYDIHMSAIRWTTYTCLYYSCCGLHVHVYNAFSVDHPAAATRCGWHDVQIPELTYFLCSTHIFKPP